MSMQPSELPGPRAGHVAVGVGRFVLIWGGYDEPFTNEKYLPPDEVWLYSPDGETWTKRLTVGAIPPGLSGACAVLMPEEWAIFLLGGHSEEGNVNTVYRLDLHSWMWTVLPPTEPSHCFSPRDKFVAWEYSRKLYIFGGYGLNVAHYLHDADDFCWDMSLAHPVRGWNNQTLEYDISSSTWRLIHATGCLPSPRAAHSVARLGNQAFLFGGRHQGHRLNDLYKFDHIDHSWTRIIVDGEMPLGRSWHSFTPVSSSQIFLFGGYSDDGVPLDDSWLFDVNTRQWRHIDLRVTVPRLWHTGTPTSDGDVVIFGGCHGDILNHEEPAEHSNSVFSFRIRPCSLLRLALSAVFEYRDLLQSQYHVLPRHLTDDLNRRLTHLS